MATAPYCARRTASIRRADGPSADHPRSVTTSSIRWPASCRRQGEENEVIELDYKQRVKKLISELTINYHYADFVNAAMDFIDDLAKSIKIYQLTCDISEDAVRCLEERMQEDGLWNL